MRQKLFTPSKVIAMFLALAMLLTAAPVLLMADTQGHSSIVTETNPNNLTSFAAGQGGTLFRTQGNLANNATVWAFQGGTSANLVNSNFSNTWQPAGHPTNVLVPNPTGDVNIDWLRWNFAVIDLGSVQDLGQVDVFFQEVSSEYKVWLWDGTGATGVINQAFFESFAPSNRVITDEAIAGGATFANAPFTLIRHFNMPMNTTNAATTNRLDRIMLDEAIEARYVILELIKPTRVGPGHFTTPPQFANVWHAHVLQIAAYPFEAPYIPGTVDQNPYDFIAPNQITVAQASTNLTTSLTSDNWAPGWTPQMRMNVFDAATPNLQGLVFRNAAGNVIANPGSTGSGWRWQDTTNEPHFFNSDTSGYTLTGNNVARTMITNNIGDSVEFTFQGGGVALYTTRHGSMFAYVDIYINGVRVARSVSLQTGAGLPQFQSKYFDSIEQGIYLDPNGTHTVRVVNAGHGNPNNTGNTRMRFDAMFVYPNNSEDVQLRGVAANPSNLPHEGGNVTLSLAGLNLDTATSINAIFEGESFPVTVLSSISATATIDIPANTRPRDIERLITFEIDGEVSRANVRIAQAGYITERWLAVRFDSPANDADMSYANRQGNSPGRTAWQEWTLPIGNGYSGANIYGVVEREWMQISEESLWLGGLVNNDFTNHQRSDERSIGLVDGQGNTITPSFYRAARDASIGSAGQTINDGPPDPFLIRTAIRGIYPTADNSGLGAYQNFAEVFIHARHQGESIAFADTVNYLRWLDIENATSGVEFEYNGVSYTREFFASYPDRVIATRFDADEQGALTLELNPVVPHVIGYSDPGVNGNIKSGVGFRADVDARTLEFWGIIDTNGLRFAGKFHVETDGVVTAGAITNPVGVPSAGMTGETLIITDATYAVIILSHGTDYVNDFHARFRTGVDPMVAVTERLDAAVARGWTELRERHIADFQEIFNRVTIDLGGEPTTATTNVLLNRYRQSPQPQNTIVDGQILTSAPVKSGELIFLEELFFQFGRYLLISSSRETTLPANLQGVWNRAHQPPWESDYHLNINLQMNYWPAANTNMPESLVSLVHYIDSLRLPGRLAARTIFGVGEGQPFEEETGWMAMVHNNPVGFLGLWRTISLGADANPNSGQPQWTPESAAWIVQNVYHMYQFFPHFDTTDIDGVDDLLADLIYPILRETSLFFSHPEILFEDPVSGRMVTGPNFSSEHGPMWAGNTKQQQILWDLFTNTIEASEILGVDGEEGGLRERLSYLRGRLYDCCDEDAIIRGPVPLGHVSGVSGRYGPLPESVTGYPGQRHGGNALGVREWWWETSYFMTEPAPWHYEWMALSGVNARPGFIPNTNPSHRHLSHLVAMFPGDLITQDTPEWMIAALNSMNIRGDGATGWSRGQKTNSWARTGDGNRAYRLFDGLIRSATFPNMKSFHDGNWFQIDGNLGGTAGVAEMLLHSHAGYIEALPALPDVWATGSVTGLTARGGFTVDMHWSDNALDTMTITSNTGRDLYVMFGRSVDPRRVIVNGGAVSVTVDQEMGTISFPTVSGESYVFTLAPNVYEPTLMFNINSVTGTARINSNRFITAVGLRGTASGTITLDTSALPTGITAEVNQGAGIITITGDPSTEIAGTFNIIVTRQGIYETLPIVVNFSGNDYTTLELDPPTVTIDNDNLTAYSTVGGTATGTITLNTDALPESVTAEVNQTTGVITVEGTRAAVVEGNFDIIVTREDEAKNLTVNVNLTPASLYVAPSEVSISNTNLVATAVVNVAEFTIDTSDLPEGVTATIGTGEPGGENTIVVTGTIPAANEAPIIDAFEIIVNRLGETAILTVNVNLTPEGVELTLTELIEKMEALLPLVQAIIDSGEEFHPIWATRSVNWTNTANVMVTRYRGPSSFPFTMESVVLAADRLEMLNEVLIPSAITELNALYERVRELEQAIEAGEIHPNAQGYANIAIRRYNTILDATWAVSAEVVEAAVASIERNIETIESLDISELNRLIAEAREIAANGTAWQVGFVEGWVDFVEVRLAASWTDRARIADMEQRMIAVIESIS